MKKKMALFLMLAFIATSACPLALAQTTTGTISGVIRDASGAVIPEAKIVVKNLATGATRDGATDGHGRYNLTNLGAGQYEIRAERTGFRPAWSNVTLSIGGAAILDLTLEVGNVSEAIKVESQEPLIEPTKAEVSRVVSEQS